MMQPFTIVDTNGILSLPSAQIVANSQDLNWSSIFVSSQVEHPFDGIFQARDPLIILFRDGAFGTDRRGGRGRYCSTPPGSLRIVPGGSKIEFTLESTSTTVHLYVRRQVIEEVAMDMVDSGAQPLSIQPDMVEDDPIMSRLVEAAEAAMLSGYEQSLYSDCLSRAIAARLIQCHSNGRITRHVSNLSGRPVSREISAVLDYMQSHLDQNVALADLARVCNRSPSHLSRLFGMQMGVPPHRYLMELRVGRARQLLEKTNISLAEIAAICGFTHQEHFTRLFRRYHDSTPGAYRRTVRS